MNGLRRKPEGGSRNKVEPALRAGFPTEHQSARAERGLHLLTILILSLPFFTAACSKSDHDHNHAHDHGSSKAASSSGHGHEHHAPHGGTPVILGDEVYHLELVHDAARGVLQAFVLDGHMENFIRCAAPSFEITATAGGEKRSLIFLPVTDAATGEKPGDASLFEAEAPWLKTTPSFEGVLTTLTIRGSAFSGVAVRFPQVGEPKH